MDSNKTSHKGANADVIEAPDLQTPHDNRSGRAVWDERGNSIWEWQTQPGVFSRDITPEQLERLHAEGLNILEHAAQRQRTIARGRG